MVSSGFERLAVRCAVITRHLARPQRSPLVRMEMDIRRAPLRLSSRRAIVRTSGIVSSLKKLPRNTGCMGG
jgi:hypothetical protein